MALYGVGICASHFLKAQMSRRGLIAVSQALYTLVECDIARLRGLGVGVYLVPKRGQCECPDYNVNAAFAFAVILRFSSASICQRSPAMPQCRDAAMLGSGDVYIKQTTALVSKLPPAPRAFGCGTLQ